MKKPNIKNWIKYWTIPLGASCMLLVGACDSNEKTADNIDLENEIEAAENQPETPEQEMVVAEVEPETTEQEENTVNQVQYDKTSASVSYAAVPFGNMDKHIAEHEEVNENIRETLRTMEVDRLYYQGDPDKENLSEEGDAYIIIYEQYRTDIEDKGYTDEERQQMDDIMNEYKLRREKMRGQVDRESGAYVSPEVDPQPEMGMEGLMEFIHENIEYPQNAAATETEGTVFVNFIVDEEGNVEEVAANPNVFVPLGFRKTQSGVLNPITLTDQEVEEIKKEMMEEAVEVVKATSGKWEPAMHNGRTVKAEIQLPVVFDVEEVWGLDE